MYTVQAGDTAGTIANANGMTLAEFAKLNNLSDPNKLRIGQTVKIAVGRSALAAGPAARPAPAAPAGYVVVQDGDTLSAIASRHGTTVKALQEANGLADANSIRSGTQLRLPGTPAARTPSAPTAAPTAAPTVAPTAAPTATVQAAQNDVHPIPPSPTVSIPTPTTRPVATIPATTRTPVRVTAAEASAAPGGTVSAGDATIDVAAALTTGSLGAARQIVGAVQAAGDQAQSSLGQISDATGRAAAGVRDAVSSGTREYVVEDGDDIYSIAMKFDSQPLRIRALNGGKSLDDLKPGDTVVVPAN